MEEQKDLNARRDCDLDSIIAELDSEHAGDLPESALREAQRHRNEITPRLIDLVRNATEAVRAGDAPDGNGHFFAFFLLTEFQAKEALPAILEAISLPGEGPFVLFGDAITEDLSSVLSALAGDSPEVIDELIANRSLNEYVRWEAAQSYLHLVRDGHMTRDVAVQRLREHLHDAIVNRDAAVAGGLIAELVSYAPREALDDIKDAFRHGLVDRMIVDLDTVEESIAGGEWRFQKELERCRPTGVQDTVSELNRWAAFREPRSLISAPIVDDDWSDVPADDELWNPPPDAVRRTGLRVGRNDPCPCGSGKKYKKCCGAA